MMRPLATILFLGILITACQTPPSEAPFRLLTADRTGLEFENRLESTEGFNVFDYMYFYNGGGVAGGDFNGDGLIDLFFTSNMGPNGLFLNEGELQFREVTQEAGLMGSSAWTTGASVVDINNDGLLDLYVSQVTDYETFKGSNQLFICQGVENGIPQFEDQAAEYGLDLVGFGTQGAFFDYDLDGDLDLFQLNHSLHLNGTFDRRDKFVGTSHPKSGDRLLRNDGHQKFTDVTKEAGIISTVLGYGLGISIGDVNLDGWPDIYIGNDFHENDYLYLNQRDGTFQEALGERMAHTSRFSMGVDIADINNDAHSEVISLDMLPEDPVILKSSLGEDPYDIYTFKLRYGYHNQFARNNLQLNRGDGTFSEIGLFAGVAATDWSWAALFLDFENDGRKDLFISNGIPRRMNDIDYINFRADQVAQRTGAAKKPELAIEASMPQIKLPNKFFRNQGQLQFEDISPLVAKSEPSYSNGAIYADLDNDGDLDVVTNNIYSAPYIYENQLESGTGHYLQLQFKGPSGNRNGIGASVLVFKGEERLFYQHFPVRGYQSALPPGLHIGIGDTSKVDSILLIWPDQSYERIDPLAFDQRHTLSWQSKLPSFQFAQLQNRPAPKYPIQDRTASLPVPIAHQENEAFIEFLREPLMPHMVSREGPALAVGDINGDGLQDFFLGGAKLNPGRLFFQSASGRFEEIAVADLQRDSLFEDVDASLADFDQDGDLDLLVASGGNEFRGAHPNRRPRLYRNDGQGSLKRDTNAFTNIYATAACVAVADFDGDQLPDVFLGSRAVPWSYGQIPSSYLFRNLGDGTFEDVTEQRSPGLRQAGLIQDGQWVDIDLDGDLDLLLAAEWSPLLIFVNEGGRFKPQSVLDHSGWWRSVLAHDFDGDGDVDILGGNLGLNSKLRASQEFPIRLYVNDFDTNGQTEPILTHYQEGREVPFASYAELTKQLVYLKKRYLYASDLAKASLDELFDPEKLRTSALYTVNTLESQYFENLGEGRFRAHPLPDELQWSTVEALAILGSQQAQVKDLLIGGNFYANNIELGRYDASYGNLLSIGPDGALKASDLGSVSIQGPVRAIRPIRIANRPCYLVAKNNAPIQILQIGRTQDDSLQ